MIETFALSLIVAALGVYFGFAQEKRIKAKVDAQHKLAFSDASLGLEQVPEVQERWRAQALDVAYNFPAAILTVVAYLHLFPGLGASVALIIVTLIVSLYFRHYFDPERAPQYWRWSLGGVVSLPTIVLLTANLVGLVIAIWRQVS